MTLAAFAFDAAADTTEPPAPATPAEIVAYHDSGEWDRDIDAVIASARDFLDRHVGDAAPRRAAAVLDIDATSLSNYECLARVDFDRAAARCGAGVQLPAIPQTRRLYRHVRRHGVAVFFLTGRGERQRKATAANLRAAGYRGHWQLVMRPKNRAHETNARFKTRERRRITAHGYRIIINVGDQASDLRGGYADRGFKLPNPMYVTR